MALKEPRSRKSFAAHVALVVEVVGEDVHGQGRHADIHLVADVALLGIGRIQSPVSLLMPRQVAASSIILSAL